MGKPGKCLVEVAVKALLDVYWATFVIFVKCLPQNLGDV